MLRVVLLLLFVGMPLLELFLLVRVSEVVGFWTTVGLVLVTGVVGASLARQQGLSVFRQMEARIGAGEVPGSQIGHGVLILVAGLLLITPGIITDVVGTLLLVPMVRTLIAKRFFTWAARRFSGRVVFHHHTTFSGEPDLSSPPPTKHIESRVVGSEPTDD